MRLLILAVGRMRKGPERELVERYVDRAAQTGRRIGFTGCEVLEVPESRASSADRRRLEEAQALRDRLPAGCRMLAFDERGRRMDSRAFADLVAGERDAARSAFACLIGGADGLDPSFRQGATVSLGAMVLPHQIVRVVVAEQLYRVTTLIAGHPYHRD